MNPSQQLQLAVTFASTIVLLLGGIKQTWGLDLSLACHYMPLAVSALAMIKTTIGFLFPRDMERFLRWAIRKA